VDFITYSPAILCEAGVVFTRVCPCQDVYVSAQKLEKLTDQKLIQLGSSIVFRSLLEAITFRWCRSTGV